MKIPIGGPRTWIALLAVVGAGALLPLAFRPPRYTLLNASLRVDYPWNTVLAGAGAAIALVAAAVMMRRWLRMAVAVAALAASILAASRLVYRLDAGADTLQVRGLFGGTMLSWREVTRIDRGPEVVVVWGKGDAQVRIDTAGFREDQRATLDRSIARRVAESTTR